VKNSLDSRDQFKVLEKSIKALRESNFKPILTIFDQCTVNVKMVAEIGVNQENPCFLIDNDPVGVFYDYPHLFKSWRNGIYSNDCLYKGKKCKFQYVKDFYKKDQQRALRLAPKLTDKHVELPAFSKMKVKYATQILSKTVSDAIKTAVEYKELPPDALGTSELLIDANNLFDVFNSSSKNTPKVSLSNFSKKIKIINLFF
jgi:hypothetical protein